MERERRKGDANKQREKVGGKHETYYISYILGMVVTKFPMPLLVFRFFRGRSDTFQLNHGRISCAVLPVSSSIPAYVQHFHHEQHVIKVVPLYRHEHLQDLTNSAMMTMMATMATMIQLVKEKTTTVLPNCHRWKGWLASTRPFLLTA